MFLTSELSVNQLDGAVFGRGVGLSFDALLGLDVQWLPAQGRINGGMIVVNPAIGLGGGIRFPKIVFKKRGGQ